MSAPTDTTPPARRDRYEYTDAQGNVVFTVTGNNADTLPETNRPPLNLPSILLHSQAPVLVVDGEQNIAGARACLPDGWEVTTWHGAPQDTDWSYLGSRTCVLWPTKGRESTMIQLRALLGAMATVVRVPDPFPSAAEATALMLASLPKPQVNGHIALKPIDTENAIVTDVPYIRSSSGAVKPIMKNVTLLLEANHKRWNLRYNEFAARDMLGDAYATDQDNLDITGWIQWNGVHAGPATVYDAMRAVCSANRYNPVHDYLNSLSWDGITRLDTLFIDHAGTPDTPLNQVYSARWFIQAVARVMDPGCQADAMLVLEGPQGLKKSTLLRELFGDMWFTDHLPDLTTKDALIQLRGVWCVEIGELATLGRAGNAKIKQFLTSRVDRYRDPYGRVVADFPRTSVFAGSVNPGASGYLTDETGARRFWPLPISKPVDVAAIRELRDQIWAEALARYHANDAWYLDSSELDGLAREGQADRYSIDPWQEKIGDYLARREECGLEEVLRGPLNKTDVGEWTQADMNRIARCLSVAGWHKIRRGTRNDRKYVYVPTTETLLARGTDPGPTADSWPDVPPSDQE